MALLEQFAFLVVGLVVLVKSADVVIEKGARLAKFLRVSELAIGFLLYLASLLTVELGL